MAHSPRVARATADSLCPVSITKHWHVSDGDDGWYVVDPGGHEDGPYGEEDASRLCRQRRKLYPVIGCTCSR